MAWAEAPAALLDLEQFGKGLESTYYEETYKDKPRLVTAFWASQLGSLMSLCTLTVTHRPNKLYLAEPASETAVDSVVVVANGYANTGQEELAMEFLHFTTGTFGFCCSDKARFGEEYRIFEN
ncbi:hypothetical protein K432DRAFT_444953 [Lepidopterella palustris CBS 459.81]|uniref:Uncharacterized protein n=1 Tax=Lepidopterella palustris CBS 459.81 TaxID=1314670 RepID=A0A8E2E610_9PEZI|nr:hypothetical protein K432DRAFT_444953 [Lepidopterella palustris CBS 459.81]